jgi:hypothetical protein
MRFEEYLNYFESILEDPHPYQDYIKMNWTRMNRWLKTGKVRSELQNVIKEPQEWLVITEPWCGDAAHTVPFIQMIAEANPMVEVKYELRDSEPFSIEKYLTNGSKSIPKLVIRDKAGNDLFVWGPRPKGCQELFLSMPKEQAIIELQKWYNEDKGNGVQEELLSFLGTGS